MTIMRGQRYKHRWLARKKITVIGSIGGGNIRYIPSSDNAESSIGFYNYQNQRSAAAGDTWVAGQNCWNRSGVSTGTVLNIDNTGSIRCPYKLTVAGNIAATDLSALGSFYSIPSTPAIILSSGRSNFILTHVSGFSVGL